MIGMWIDYLHNPSDYGDNHDNQLAINMIDTYFIYQAWRSILT